MEKYTIFNNQEYESRQQEKIEVHNLLDTLDFERLKTIFSSMIQPSRKADVNILGREAIGPEDEESGNLDDATGIYDIKKNKIYLNTSQINKWPEEYKNLAIINLVSHEMTHGISRVQCENNSLIFKDTGFRTSTIKNNGKRQIFFTLFDEAVTEKIAKQITLRYIDGEKNRTELIQKLKGVGSNYDSYIVFLDKFINLLAKNTGFPEQVIWEGILESYINGEDLFDQELRTNLEETLYKGILDDIAKIKTENDADTIISKIEKGQQQNIFKILITKIKNKLHNHTA